MASIGLFYAWRDLNLTPFIRLLLHHCSSDITQPRLMASSISSESSIIAFYKYTISSDGRCAFDVLGMN
jgi:hypothetical protein